MGLHGDPICIDFRAARKASAILRLNLTGWHAWLTVSCWVTPFRPFTRRTALSAADR